MVYTERAETPPAVSRGSRHVTTKQLCKCMHQHVIIQELLAFYSAFLNIHPSGVLKRCLVVTWLVPREIAAVSARSVYTIQPCTMSRHFKQSHIRRVHACLAVACHLHFWQKDRDLLRATVVARGGTDTEIRVSTES